jgi:nitric oxide reductase activation protein
MKPQGRERLRRLELGSELDLDLAQQALIDWRSGHTPSDRVQQHWRPHQRDVSVQLVMDLSASLAERVAGSEQTVLQVSQSAVAILGWALQQLGDALAIGGFHSNSRQEVRYMHLKGFGEDWGPDVKARLAAIAPAYSTRLGAALRHGARPLVQRKSPRKLLLVITDGEPSDVDVNDPDYLAQDARHVVRELQAQGVFVWCIQLHPAHEASVRTVFGEHYTLVDHIEQLPQVLAHLFLRLTR